MKKSYILIAIALVATLLLGACGTPTETPVVETEPPVVEEPTEVPTVEEPTEVPTVEEPVATLRIWADEQRAPVLSELGAQFKAEYNVDVVVENISGIRDQFLVAAPAGEGPDIIVLAHDQLPALIASGLIAEIDLGAKAADFDPESLKAFTYEGKLYGMPYARENLGFFYNADLVTEVPTTWQGVYDLSKTLIEEDKVQYGIVLGGTTYDAYPWMTSQGGYVFGLDENGDYDPTDIGVGSEGMIKFGEMALQWKNDGILSDNLDNTTAKSMFLNGDVAFFMNGPWEINNLKESGLNFGIAKFPDGGYPFLGVQGFAVNALSENVLLAQTFLTEFVATEEAMLALYEADPRSPAYLPAAAKIDDPYLKAIAEAGENAVPMPAIPEMGAVWADWGNALTFIFDGSKTPEQAYTDAANNIQIAISSKGMVNVPGSYQTKVGCASDWMPYCAQTALTLGEDGKYTGTFTIPAGDYECKVALDGGWATSYGVGDANENYKFTVTTDGEVTFIFDPETHELEIITP
jgi:maltose/maltodextrin transport system substrate-binding protein/arabinogalactan oligomer/maltooligosaccharide transport system substrate-binding protein